MPEFSIVVPVYGGEAYVGRLLESLLDQPFEDFEIICVDDASLDGSFAVLEDYACRDARVRAIRQEENRGCARARRRGVLESEGRYVLFADQDDEFCPDSLSCLAEELTRDEVDVLAFDAEVLNVGGVGADELEGVQSWMRAPAERLEGRDILDACFVENRYGYSIWNKAYRGDMARDAFERMDDVAIPLGEDNYAYFVLAYAARTFRGMPGRFLYRYHYGAGFTGHGSLSLDGWERTSSLSVAAALIEGFLKREQAFEEFEGAYRAAREHMLDYAFEHYRSEIAETDKRQALKMSLQHWEYDEVLVAVARHVPCDLPMLTSVRFGEDRCSDDLIRWVETMASKLVEVEEQQREARRTVRDVRIAYEESRAYRWGRKITAPLRFVKGA